MGDPRRGLGQRDGAIWCGFGKYSYFSEFINNVVGQLSTIHAQLRQHESPLPYFLVRKDASGTVSLSPVEAFDSFFASTPPEAVGIPSYPILRLMLTNIFSTAHYRVRWSLCRSIQSGMAPSQSPDIPSDLIPIYYINCSYPPLAWFRNRPVECCMEKSNWNPLSCYYRVYYSGPTKSSFCSWLGEEPARQTWS